MKKLIVLLSVVLLSGCDAETTEISSKYALPDGLKDCTVYELNPSTGRLLYVVRCPHSDTTTNFLYNKQYKSVAVTEK